MTAISRRSFLRLSSLALTSALFPRPQPEPDWPRGVPLGRVTPKRFRLISHPHPDKVEVFRARIGSGRTYFGDDGTTLGCLIHPHPSPRAALPARATAACIRRRGRSFAVRRFAPCPTWS